MLAYLPFLVGALGFSLLTVGPARKEGTMRLVDVLSTLMVRGLVVTAALIAITACAGPPDWVEEGSGALHKEDSKAFYGVGSVIGVKNEPLAWDTAENRARAELAKNFETYTGYLMRDYAASTNAGDFTSSTEEQNVERAIKTFSAVTLHGVRPVDRYKDDDTFTYYVLAKLALKDAKEAIQESKELDGQMRDFVRDNAERLFDRLEQEENQQAPGK